MTNYKLHEDCKILSGYVYKEEKPKNINGWHYLEALHARNGFYTEIYQKDNDIMIVFRGTDTERGVKELAIDADDDLKMSTMYISPGQLKNARSVYKKYRTMYPEAKIILTGHSLGGSIGQALGAETGAETITFAAYGMGHTYSQKYMYRDNITNYGNAQDGIFTKNIDYQIGKTIILDSNAKPGDSFEKKSAGLKNHHI